MGKQSPRSIAEYIKIVTPRYACIFSAPSRATWVIIYGCLFICGVGDMRTQKSKPKPKSKSRPKKRNYNPLKPKPEWDLQLQKYFVRVVTTNTARDSLLIWNSVECVHCGGF